MSKPQYPPTSAGDARPSDGACGDTHPCKWPPFIDVCVREKRHKGLHRSSGAYPCEWSGTSDTKAEGAP
jgi:hypothetical protein